MQPKFSTLDNRFKISEFLYRNNVRVQGNGVTRDPFKSYTSRFGNQSIIKKLNESSIDTNNSLYKSIRFTGRKELESDLSMMANTADGVRQIKDYSPDPLCDSSLLHPNDSVVRTSSIRERSEKRKKQAEMLAITRQANKKTRTVRI